MSAVHVPPGPQAAPAIDALPDAILSDVLKTLGLRAGWPLRGVCRRWRRVAEDTPWPSLELRFRSGGGGPAPAPAAAASDASGAGPRPNASGGDRFEEACGALSTLFEQRKLRLAGGASVALRPELAPGPSRRAADVAEARQRHRGALEAACRLLAAITRSYYANCGPADHGAGRGPHDHDHDQPPAQHGLQLGPAPLDPGPAPQRQLRELSAHPQPQPQPHGQPQPLAQLRGVTVELYGSSAELFTDRYLGSAGFLPGALLALLAALRPPEAEREGDREGAAADPNEGLGCGASGLERLSVGLVCKPRSMLGSCEESSPWPAPAELRTALAPFAQLRSLDLFFETCPGATPATAAAIAGACPLLRSLSLTADNERVSKVLAALAPLSRLEDLAVALGENEGAPEGLAALAAGPAGQSLRALAFFEETGLYEEGEFPARWGGARPASLEMGGADRAALARLPNLESFSP